MNTHSVSPKKGPRNGEPRLALAMLVLSAAMVNPLAMTALLSVLPTISAEFSDVPNAPALVRGLVSIVAIALVFAAPLAALVVERFGMRRVLMASAAAFVVSGMSGYFIDNLWLLLVSRTVLGVADAFIGTLVIAHVATSLDQRRRARWIGWYTFAAAAGAFAIIPLSGTIGKTGWHNVFLLYALALPILFSAAIVIKPQTEKSGGATPPAHRNAKTGTAWLVRIPLALIAIGLISGAVENTTHVFLPFRLHDLGETSPTRIAQGVLPIAIGGAASAFCYGFLRDRISISAIFFLSFTWGGLSLIWIGQATAYGMIVAAGVSLGLGVGMLAPNANAYAAERAGDAGAARAVGFTRGAFFAGSPVAQIMLEPIATSNGSGSAISALGIFSLFLAGLYALLLRRSATRNQPVQV